MTTRRRALVVYSAGVMRCEQPHVPTSTMSTGPPPPDVQAARKARINSELIQLCSKPAPFWSIPSAHGIGLYTHVAGPKTAGKNPHSSYADKADGEVALLPLGGPTKIAPSNLRDPPSREVAAVYKQLQDAVDAEEKIWSDMRAAADAEGEPANNAYRMSFAALQDKYGAVTASDEVVGLRPDVERLHKRRHSEVMAGSNDETSERRRVRFASQSELRQGADTGRRGSDGKTGNEYDVYRDPRRRGR